MKIRFLLDENLSKQIKFAVLRKNSLINILCVGDHKTDSAVSDKLFFFIFNNLSENVF